MLARSRSGRVLGLQRCLRAQSTPAAAVSRAVRPAEDRKYSTKHPPEKIVEDMFETLTNEFVIGTGGNLRGRHFASTQDAKRAMDHTVPPSGAPARVASLQKQEFFAQEVDVDDFGPQLRDLHPGDYVEVRRNNIVSHGIVIDFVLGYQTAAQVLSITSSGEMWVHLPLDVQFTVPHFVGMDTVVACGNKPKAMSPTEQKTRLALVKRIRNFEREVEDKYRGLGRRVTRLYPLLASSNPSVWSKVTTKQALSLLDSREPPPVSTLLALHQHLMMRHQYFVCDEVAHLRTHTFLVRPRRDVENIEKVVQWVVDRSSYLQSFISKARELIKLNRGNQREWENMPLGMKKASDVEFTPQDLEIIYFLKCSVRRRRSIQSDPYLSYARSIVNEIGLYSSTVTTETTHSFLQEIGVYAPWDDPIINDHSAPRFTRTLEETMTFEEEIPPIPKAISLQAIADVGESANPNLSPAFGELYKYDTVESQRHDFGDLPVFVIDDYGAEELDDGISVEALPGSKDKFWIHIHVADPTLLLPPDHVLARRAEIHSNSQYFLQGSQPMLPTEFGSLIALGASQPGGHRAVTFSAVVDRGGNITDLKVRASIIRNIHVMKYNDVDATMGWGDFRERAPFEPPPPPITPPAHLSQWRDALSTIFKVTSRLTRRRGDDGCIVPLYPNVQLTAKNRPFPGNSGNGRDPLIFYGGPDLRYEIDNDSGTNGARNMVAECMKLACRTASRWFISQGIPGIRRTMGPYEFSRNEGEPLDELRQLQKRQGYVDIVDIQKAGVLHPRSVNMLEPKGHSVLGVIDGEGYIRVTSPLRRYMDLVHHWQIKHILAGGSRETIPFPQATLADRLMSWSRREDACAKSQRKQMGYWAVKYIAEKLKLPPDDPTVSQLHDLRGRVFGPPVWDPRARLYRTPVVVDSLGLRANIPSGRKDMAPPVGTAVPLKVTKTELDINPSIEVEIV